MIAISIPKIVETTARMPSPKRTPSTRSLRIFTRRGGSGPNSGVTVAPGPSPSPFPFPPAPSAAGVGAAARAALRRARRPLRGSCVKAWWP